MTSTLLSKELCNELNRARGKNALIFALGEPYSEISRLIESAGLEVHEIDLRKEGRRFLEILSQWVETPEGTVYLVHGISSQFPWILGYINLHRDLLFDIKRPVVMVVNLYEIRTIQQDAPDFYRFRSRTYDFSKGEASLLSILLRDETSNYPMQAAEKTVDRDHIEERIRYDKYLLEIITDIYKRSELLMDLSISHFKIDEVETGEEYFRRSMEIKKEVEDEKGIIENLFRLGAGLDKNKYPDKIIAIYTILIDAFESNAIDRPVDLRTSRANDGETRNLFLFSGKIIEISLSPERLKSFQERMSEAYSSRGSAFDLLDKPDRAVEDFTRAIEIDPQASWAYLGRGSSFITLGQLDRAVKDYSRAIGLDPENVLASSLRSIAFLELDPKYSAIIDDMRGAIELNLEFASACSNLVSAVQELLCREKALKDLRKAEALSKLGEKDPGTKAEKLDPKNPGTSA